MSTNTILQKNQSQQNQNGVNLTPIIVSVSTSDILSIEQNIVAKHNAGVTNTSLVGRITPIEHSCVFNEWSIVDVSKPELKCACYKIRVSDIFKNRYIEYTYKKNTIKVMSDMTIQGVSDNIAVAKVCEDGTVVLRELRDCDVIRNKNGSTRIHFRLLWLPDGTVFNSGLNIYDK